MDNTPAYEFLIDKLLIRYDLQHLRHSSMQSKLAYLIIEMDKRIRLLENPFNENS